ncbi:ParA family protein [Paludisphaera sp.]|uniref:ParA family protein n=1 Tax=Paludisphaera sp. TaxID=2017432 RepID=UPI00301B6FAA
MQVVTLLNLKGGVGKTSSTHHLSGALALGHGLRILAVDADPQASLTQGWWGPSGTMELDPRQTISSVLAGDMPSPSMVIHETGVPGLSLLPGADAAGWYNDSRPLESPREARETIREFLGEVREDFDMVLIDCPPNLYGCSFAALAASDWIVVPVQPEDYGSQGIAKVLNSLDAVRAEGYGVDLLGYLLTMVQPRRALHRAYEERLRSAYGPLVFDARFPELPEFPEAIAARKLIHQYKPKGAAAKATRAVADELLARIAGTHGQAVEGKEVAA